MINEDRLGDEIIKELVKEFQERTGMTTDEYIALMEKSTKTKGFNPYICTGDEYGKR